MAKLEMLLPEGIAHLQGSSDAVARVKVAMALCEGYTLEELQRMSLTFKAQIEAIELVRQREREACAAICDDRSDLYADEGGCARSCAAAIRARSEVPSHD